MAWKGFEMHGLEAFVTRQVVYLVAVAICLALQAGFLMVGANFAQIRGRSYGKALAVAGMTGLALVVLRHLPLVGGLFTVFGGFLTTALVGMSVFNTTFGKSALAAIVAWLASLVVGLVLALGCVMLLGSAALLGVH